MANRAKGDEWHAQRRPSTGPHSLTQARKVTPAERVAWARANLRAACERLRRHPDDAYYASSVIAHLDRLESAEHVYATTIDCPTCHTPRALPVNVSVASITAGAELALKRRSGNR